MSSNNSSDNDKEYIPPLTSSFDLVLEPTPIASQNIEIVDQVRLEDTNFFGFSLMPAFQEEYFQKEISKSPLQSLDLDEQNNPCKRQKHVHAPTNITEDVSKSHLEKWHQRFKDLLLFHKKYGHCLVPLNWPENQQLAHWIKHQRCQYKAKLEGKHSTLTHARQEALEKLGFVWDSRRAAWEERFNELLAFRNKNGHCNVPTNFKENPKLSTWVKCQRRQYKLFLEGKKTHMTRERISKLSSVYFVWFPRKSFKDNICPQAPSNADNLFEPIV